MASLEELEARLTALETKVQQFGADAAAARILAGGADRDVSAFAARLDAQTKLLTALRETQVEQGQKLDEHSAEIAGLKQDVASLSQRVDQGFSTLAVGQAEITALLNRLIDPETGE